MDAFERDRVVDDAPDSNFLMIGERTNVTGSRKFANLIRNDRFEEAIEVARQQVQTAHRSSTSTWTMHYWTAKRRWRDSCV